MKQYVTGNRMLWMKNLTLVLVWICWMAAPAFAGDSPQIDRPAIVPDQAIQSSLEALVSADEQQVAVRTEESVRESFEQLRKMAGTDKELVLQLLYFDTHARTERARWLSMAIVKLLEIPNETFVEVGLSLLNAGDDATQRLAFKCLARTDRNSDGDIDFGRYEAILRDKRESPPQGLIRYMYDRDSQAAVIAVARVYSPNVPEPEIVAHTKRGVIEAADYFASRPEWWAHLYVATMMNKEPYLQTPALMKRLQNETDPLVRQVLDRLPASLEENAAPAEPPAAAKTLKTFELHIPFGRDKADIDAGAQPQLDEIAQLLKANPQFTARVEGHTDKTKKSSVSYSQKLTERRAQAVLDYVAKIGEVEASRISAVGVGFAFPKAPNDPVMGNPENRRIVVHIQEGP